MNPRATKFGWEFFPKNKTFRAGPHDPSQAIELCSCMEPRACFQLSSVAEEHASAETIARRLEPAGFDRASRYGARVLFFWRGTHRCPLPQQIPVFTRSLLDAIIPASQAGKPRYGESSASDEAAAPLADTDGTSRAQASVTFTKVMREIGAKAGNRSWLLQGPG